VDNEPSLVRLGTRLLERLNYEVTAATSSLEAWEWFRLEPNRFDLVLTDQTMPHLTGCDLAVRLLAIRPNLPIILATGYSAQVDGEQIKMLGIRELLLKPMGMHTLAETVYRALSHARSNWESSHG
jgi:two-component system, cell cycle sensor histidine kinase and response regulator CckA